MTATKIAVNWTMGALLAVVAIRCIAAANDVAIGAPRLVVQRGHSTAEKPCRTPPFWNREAFARGLEPDMLLARLLYDRAFGTRSERRMTTPADWGLRSFSLLSTP